MDREGLDYPGNGGDDRCRPMMPCRLLPAGTSMTGAHLYGLELFNWPSHLFVAQNPQTKRYALFEYEGIVGLAVFSRAELVERRLYPAVSYSMEPQRVTFDTARAIAKSMEDPAPMRGCVALILLDVPSAPQVHWVK